MSVRKIPWLSELIPVVSEMLDQYEGEPGETWPRESIARFANLAQKEVFNAMVDVDRGWAVTSVDTSTITSGSRTISLPASCKRVLAVKALDSSSDPDSHYTHGPLALHGLDDSGLQFEHRPTTNQLILLDKPTQAETLRIWFVYYPIPTVHGIIQSAGTLTATLEDHEPFDDDVLIGQAIRIYHGTALGQQRTATDWDGSTKLWTQGTAWTVGVLPVIGSKYTSRPDLPQEAELPFLYLLASMLADKNNEELSKKYRYRYDDHMRDMKHRASIAESVGPQAPQDVMGLVFHDQV